MAAHPGTITYVDGATDRVERVAPAEELPFEERFVNGLPVVRVVTLANERGRVVHELGPERQVLRTRVERKQ